MKKYVLVVIMLALLACNGVEQQYTLADEACEEATISCSYTQDGELVTRQLQLKEAIVKDALYLQFTDGLAKPTIRVTVEVWNGTFEVRCNPCAFDSKCYTEASVAQLALNTNSLVPGQAIKGHLIYEGKSEGNTYRIEGCFKDTIH